MGLPQRGTWPVRGKQLVGQDGIREQVTYGGGAGGEPQHGVVGVGGRQQLARPVGPAGQVPQPAGKLRGVGRGPHRQPLAQTGEVIGPLEIEVRRAYPDTLTQLGQTKLRERRPEARPVGGGAAGSGHHDHVPVTVPGAGLHMDRRLLPALAVAQPLGEPVSPLRSSDQVVGGDHAGERDPDRRLREADQTATRDELAGGQRRHLGAHEQTQERRSGGHRAKGARIGSSR